MSAVMIHSPTIAKAWSSDDEGAFVAEVVVQRGVVDARRVRHEQTTGLSLVADAVAFEGLTALIVLKAYADTTLDGLTSEQLAAVAVSADPADTCLLPRGAGPRCSPVDAGGLRRRVGRRRSQPPRR